MSGSTTPGTALSFTSTTGQTFTVQATGDTGNLLGLGSFLTSTGAADYTTFSGTAYTAATGQTATGNAHLEFSFNGGSSVQVNGATGIDLTAGNAVAATATGTGVVATPNAFVIGAAATMSVTVGAVGPTVITLTATQAATSGSVEGATDANVNYAAPLTGLTFAVKVDGGLATTVTLGADANAAALLADINGQLTGAVASFDIGTGRLTIKSTAGSTHSVQISAVGAGTTAATGLSVGNNSTGTDASSSLQDIAGQIQAQLTAAGALATVSLSGAGQDILNITSTAKGAGAKVNVTAVGAGATGLNLAVATHSGTNRTASDVKDYLNQVFSTGSGDIQDAQLTASESAGVITIASNNSTQFRVTSATTAAAADIGFGSAQASFTTGLVGNGVGSAMSTLQAFGTSQSTMQSFTDMKFGNDSQAITFSANDTTGALETTTITLQNTGLTRSGRSIDDAVAYINQQLQQSISNPALQKIVAVKELDSVSGLEKINFISALGKFTVGVASTANGGGINGGVASTILSGTNGSASSMSVDSQAGALQSVTAIAAAIGALGSAQAAVGKGQNQLNYAVNLAQSQVSNFSAAESRIRDADVAAEAANLTKAQVLQQASMAAMAQANSAPQAVMALLRG